MSCCGSCVLHDMFFATFVKFCPAKPGVQVWNILGDLRDDNFCNTAGFDCSQCFIFNIFQHALSSSFIIFHHLHPNPAPNSICLDLPV